MLSEKNNLTEKELQILQSEMSKKMKNPVIAWILWFFAGSIGGHLFYMGKNGLGLTYLSIYILSWLTVIIFIGFIGFGILAILIFIDIFLMSGRIEEANNEVEARIVSEILSMR